MHSGSPHYTHGIVGKLVGINTDLLARHFDVRLFNFVQRQLDLIEQRECVLPSNQPCYVFLPAFAELLFAVLTENVVADLPRRLEDDLRCHHNRIFALFPPNEPIDATADEVAILKLFLLKAQFASSDDGHLS